MRQHLLPLFVLLSCLPAFAQTSVPTCDMHAWSERDHFRDANAKLLEQKPERRVVFIGASLLAGWDLEKTFPGKEYVNRGIAGEGTAQMLLRFHQDVTQLRPRAVVIFPGLNDIIQGASIADIQENLIMMAQLAKANNVRVLLASAQPINASGSNQAVKGISPEKIRELNRWIFQYAKDHADTYVDIWSPLGDEKYMMRADITSDGIHPNRAGYKLLAPVLEKRITEALTMATGRVALKGE